MVGGLMKIAYVRVSSVDQNQARQEEALRKYNIEKWFKEKVSGKDTNRPQLQEMLEFIREGDVLYIHDFSRLARSTRDLLDLIDILNSKKAKLVSIKENLDTSTATGKLMVTVISAINEFERANLLERQREGIAIAKREGKYKGRVRVAKPDNWSEIYKKYMHREIKAIKAVELCNVSRATFYRWLKDEKK